MALFLIAVWVVLLACAYADYRRERAVRRGCPPEPSGSGADRLGALRCDAEMRLGTALLDGSLDRADYRQRMAALAAMDAGREPVLTPPDPKPSTDANGEMGSGPIGGWLGPTWIAWPWWRQH